MYSKREYKMRLLRFPELRTVPEVAIEVRKREDKTSYLLDEFQKAGGLIVGRESFHNSAPDRFYEFVISHAASYSPATQAAIAENLKQNNSPSPIEHNALVIQTEHLTFLPSPDVKRDKAACEKVRKSWYKYHREREQSVKDNSYLWTDEKLISSAITDGLVNNCVSLVLTNDWDPYTIIKQFMDNVIYQSVKLETGKEAGVDVFDNLYDQRCSIVDRDNENRRSQQAMTMLDGGALFEVCEPSDLFVWHYPTEKFLSFGFSKEFKNWLDPAWTSLWQETSTS